VDFTEQLRAQTALAEAHAQATKERDLYAAIMHEMPIGVTVFRLDDPADDESLRYVFANPAADRLLNRDHALDLGRRLVDARPQARATGLLPHLARVARTGEPFDIGEIRYPRPDGVWRWYRPHVFALPDRCIGCVYDDVTERKEAEEQVSKRTAELGCSNAELEQFAYIASHELQEPLRKIRAFGERLQPRAELLDDEGRDYLRRMVAAAERMAKLIDGLLTYSRAGRQVL
jgi:signal transduction histidine kinase